MITLESSNTIAPPSAKSSNPKGRTLRSNRVYGKRKVNAATAVLEGETTSSGKGSLGDKFAEPNSPALNELVRNVQIKLSEIKIEEHSPNKADNEKKPRIAVEIRRVVVPAQEDGIKNNCTGPVKDYIPEAQIKEGTYCHGEAKKLEPTKLKLNRKERQKKVSKNEAQHGDDVIIEKYVAPILQEATSVKNLENFNSWANRAGNTFDVEKIAEGSYGEVYQLRVRNDLSKKEKAAKLRAFDNGVFKIVPLRAQRGPGSKKFTPIHEVVAEVQMLKLLDPIPGFARFRDVHVVQGRLPTAYQAAWLHYSRTRDDCYNPDPSKKKSYPDNQLWAILEMDNAGYELEKFDCSSIFQIYDIFWGVALSLARAEQFACFEVSQRADKAGEIR